MDAHHYTLTTKSGAIAAVRVHRDAPTQKDAWLVDLTYQKGNSLTHTLTSLRVSGDEYCSNPADFWRYGTRPAPTIAAALVDAFHEVKRRALAGELPHPNPLAEQVPQAMRDVIEIGKKAAEFEAAAVVAAAQATRANAGKTYWGGARFAIKDMQDWLESAAACCPDPESLAAVAVCAGPGARRTALERLREMDGAAAALAYRLADGQDYRYRPRRLLEDLAALTA